VLEMNRGDGSAKGIEATRRSAGKHNAFHESLVQIVVATRLLPNDRAVPAEEIQSQLVEWSPSYILCIEKRLNMIQRKIDVIGYYLNCAGVD